MKKTIKKSEIKSLVESVVNEISSQLAGKVAGMRDMQMNNASQSYIQNPSQENLTKFFNARNKAKNTFNSALDTAARNQERNKYTSNEYETMGNSYYAAMGQQAPQRQIKIMQPQVIGAIIGQISSVKLLNKKGQPFPDNTDAAQSWNNAVKTLAMFVNRGFSFGFYG